MLLMARNSGGAFVGGGGGSGGGATTFDGLTGVTPVAGWGTVLLNSAYTGPALRVEDNSNPGTTTDVYFDADGYLTGAIPYGANARVVILYDQFGSDNLTAPRTNNMLQDDALTLPSVSLVL